MGFRLYKSVGLGKGLRLNLSKTGVGISTGIPGFRYSVHSSGRKTTTLGLPGSGVYYRTQRGGTTRRATPSPSRRTVSRRPSPVPQVSLAPRAGLFAPRDEKGF